MKRKQSIYFVCLAALASIAQAQEGKVAIPIEPPTLTYASEFQTTLVEKVHREDSALLLLANRALTNPEDIVLAHGTRMRLIDLVLQEIVLRLTSGCQNAQRTTAIESLGLLIRGSSTGKSHLRFNDVLEQLRQNPEIVSDGESWLTILNHLHVVSTQWIETLLSKRTDLNQLAKNLQSKQTEGESLQQEIEFVEKFAADEAKAAAVKLDDSATYWDEALSKLKGKVAVNTPESFEHLAKADDQYKPIYDNLVTIEKRKRALDLLKIETDTRISKMLLSIYEQKRRLAKLNSEIAKLQEDKTTKTDELKNLTQLFQERTMETRGFLSRFANASSSRVARDTVANLAYALHKASLTYDGPNAFLGSYATTEKPAKGKYAIATTAGAPTSVGDIPGVSISLRSASERAGVTATAPFDPANASNDPYKRPSKATHYPSTDDQGKRKPSAPPAAAGKVESPRKAQGATPAQGARPAVDPA